MVKFQQNYVGAVLMKTTLFLAMMTISLIANADLLMGQHRDYYKSKSKASKKEPVIVEQVNNSTNVVTPAAATSSSSSTPTENLDYIKLTKESSINMLIEATKKLEAGKITKDEYISVAKRVSQTADYSNKVSGIVPPSANGMDKPSDAPAAKSASASAKVASNSSEVNGVCGETLNSCVSGIFEDDDDQTNYDWVCKGASGGTSVVCKFNDVKMSFEKKAAYSNLDLNKGVDFATGACGKEPNTCAIGTMLDPKEESTRYVWLCGSNGSWQNCTQDKKQNAICYSSDTINACYKGKFKDSADSSSQYIWTCLGIAGGQDATCTVDKATYKLAYDTYKDDPTGGSSPNIAVCGTSPGVCAVGRSNVNLEFFTKDITPTQKVSWRCLASPGYDVTCEYQNGAMSQPTTPQCGEGVNHCSVGSLVKGSPLTYPDGMKKWECETKAGYSTSCVSN